eukprot:4184105-Alexandrium_andersonii.AAC.1
MSASLVGSEMCIRDSCRWTPLTATLTTKGWRWARSPSELRTWIRAECSCLLYTSDAADDM